MSKTCWKQQKTKEEVFSLIRPTSPHCYSSGPLVLSVSDMATNSTKLLTATTTCKLTSSQSSFDCKH